MDDSRRRSILIIAATIFVGASLGYLYSFMRSNRLLTEEHASLRYNFNLCSGLKRKCTDRLDACIYSSSLLQGSEKKLKMMVSREQVNGIAKSKDLETAREDLTKVYKTYFDVARLLDVTDQNDGVGNDKLTPDLVTSVTEKINELKQLRLAYLDLKPKYDEMLGKFTALTGEKESLSQNARQLDADKKSIAASHEELSKEKATLLQVEAALRRQVQELEHEKNTLQASLGEMLKPKKRTTPVQGDAGTINKIIDSEKATVTSIEKLVEKIDNGPVAVNSTSQVATKVDAEKTTKTSTDNSQTTQVVQSTDTSGQGGTPTANQVSPVATTGGQEKVGQSVAAPNTQEKVVGANKEPSTEGKVVQTVTDTNTQDKPIQTVNKQSTQNEVN